MPGYTTTYRYSVERNPKEEECAGSWVKKNLKNAKNYKMFTYFSFCL